MFLVVQIRLALWRGGKPTLGDEVIGSVEVVGIAKRCKIRHSDTDLSNVRNVPQSGLLYDLLQLVPRVHQSLLAALEE